VRWVVLRVAEYVEAAPEVGPWAAASEAAERVEARATEAAVGAAA